MDPAAVRPPRPAANDEDPTANFGDLLSLRRDSRGAPRAGKRAGKRESNPDPGQALLVRRRARAREAFRGAEPDVEPERQPAAGPSIREGGPVMEPEPAG